MISVGFAIFLASLPVGLILGQPQGPARAAPTCELGAFSRGPTCQTFYICAPSVHGDNKQVLFSCGRGTVFDPLLSVCVYPSPAICSSNSFHDSTITFPGPPGGGGTAPQVVAPPSPSPSGGAGASIATVTLPFPDIDGDGQSGSAICPKFKLDEASVVNCSREGKWEHPADCVRFYQCIHTMDCIIKGFVFQCPKSYQFDPRSSKCLPRGQAPQCTKQADDSGPLGGGGGPGNGFFVFPVIQLKPETIKDFEQAQDYWDYVPFLPADNQRIVPRSEYWKYQNL